MNKVAHYNGFVGRCQQYGLTKQAADMLYKQAQAKYPTGGWAPEISVHPTPRRTDLYYPYDVRETSIPRAPFSPDKPAAPLMSDAVLRESHSLNTPTLFRYLSLYPDMRQERHTLLKRDPKYGNWFKAHKESLEKATGKTSKFGVLSCDPKPCPPGVMEDIYHNSMYNLTNGTPRVVAPAPQPAPAPAPGTPGVSRGRSYDF